MDNQSPLENHVNRYHEQRVGKWYRIYVVTLSVVLALIGTVTIIALYSVHHGRKTHQALAAQHAMLLQQWKHLQKETRELKALKEAHDILVDNKLSHFLQALARSIPAHTLLTSLSFTAPKSITLQGYAESHEELATFIKDLASNQMKVNIKHSAQHPQAVSFELESEASLKSKSQKKSRNQKARLVKQKPRP